MRPRNTLFTICSVLFLTLSAQAQASTAALDSMVFAAKNHIYNLRLREAEQSLLQIQKQFPSQPQGYVDQAFISMLFYGMNRGSDSLAQVLDGQLKVATRVIKNYRKNHRDSPESYFYAGINSGIRGIYHVTNLSYIKAYIAGKSAKGNLEKAVKMDSTYYDAYLGLGIFHYYADLLPGFIKFIASILGFSGDRQKGMKEVQQAWKNGRFFKPEAEFIYYAIRFFLEGDKSGGAAGLKDLYKRYPGNQGLGLILAYHYRRSGYMQRCIEFCKNMSIEEQNGIALLSVLRYYNMAVAYFDLNQFDKSDSLFALMNRLPVRKSRYYEAAIAYFRGHMADLRFDRKSALILYKQIPEHKRAKYWYAVSRMMEKHPTDSLMYRYFIARNFLYSRQFSKSMKEAQKLAQELDAGEKSVNPNFPYLAKDLLAENYYYNRQLASADSIFRQLAPGLEKMDDEFRRPWVYIHYARCLRKLNRLGEAEEMLNYAGKSDDDYTKLVVSREKFIIDKRKEKFDQQKAQVEK